MTSRNGEFGVVVACCAHDYTLALGCLASVRHFMPRVPVALIVDGDFSMPRLERLGPVRVIRRADVRDAFLREKSFGWGVTKMIAFWESPWERFLFLDADTVLWGDISRGRSIYDVDVILDRPARGYSVAEITTYFFDPHGIEMRFPNFHWRDRLYANSGAFYARRGILDVAEYREVLQLAAKNPGLFQCGEQGLLNFLIFRAADECRLSVRQDSLQTLVPDHPVEILRQRFTIRGGKPCLRPGDEQVIHWCGTKPRLIRGAAFHAPMTYFRSRIRGRGIWWITDILHALRQSRLGRSLKRRLGRGTH